ncbi:hypothetical protein ABEG17_00330 [Pedococcus sp. KACC 23699]|uniref:Uncharacterized protein n=1 Tax=Pedococcus sp. KACC 23699 TaxID=3149228 RepID=A0AAU7JTQ1_9MICO
MFSAWEYRALVVLPFVALFILDILWLRAPEPPGPRWLIVGGVLLLVALGVWTVRSWRRTQEAPNR